MSEQYVADAAAWVGGVSGFLNGINWGGWLNSAISGVDKVLGRLLALIPGAGIVYAVVEDLIGQVERLIGIVIELLDSIF